MYITKVLSYKGAWETLQREHAGELQDIIECLEKISLSELKDLQNDLVEKKLSPSLIQHRIRSKWQSKFYRYKWTRLGNINAREKNKVGMVFAFTSQEYFRWVFSDSVIAYKDNKINVSILLVLDLSAIHKLWGTEKVYQSTFSYDKLLQELNILAPISLTSPFVIFGIGLTKKTIKINELSSIDDLEAQKIVYDRCLEFPPEYRQAGINILSYFGSVLDEKYPEQKAKVRIEQDGLKVRMVVEAENGDKEVIEKAMHDYSLIVTGKAGPEQMGLNPIQALELKNQLRAVHLLVEQKKELLLLQNQIIEAKDITINRLENLLEKALTQPLPAIQVNLNNQLANNNHNSNSQTNTFNLKSEIKEAYQDIERLLDLPLDDSLKAKLESIQTQLDQLKNASQEEVREAGVMSKLKKLLEDAGTVGGSINTILENTDKGMEYMQKLGGAFNKIAQWAGFN